MRSGKINIIQPTRSSKMIFPSSTQDTQLPATQQVLTETGYCLSVIQLRIVGNEAIRQYKLHTEACEKSGIDPDDFNKFVLEVAEQMCAGIYDQYRMTEVNDDGCQRLLQAVVVRAQRMTRLNQWHQRYVAACKGAGLRAFALQLILDAVNAASISFSLSNDSLSTQTERINDLVADYVKVANRKENPQWYAHKPQRTKPSKDFNKYAY